MLHRHHAAACKVFNSRIVALTCGGLCTAFTGHISRELLCQVAFAASFKSEARDLIECTLSLEVEAEINQDLKHIETCLFISSNNSKNARCTPREGMNSLSGGIDGNDTKSVDRAALSGPDVLGDRADSLLGGYVGTSFTQFTSSHLRALDTVFFSCLWKERRNFPFVFCLCNYKVNVLFS